jgi:sugar-specific transcriptional regulator TrmB
MDERHTQSTDTQIPSPAENDERLDRLRRAGLSRYESLVFLGLVQDRNARVVEIARRTGVPQPKVYQALDSLVEKGFCAIGADAVNRYRPVDPELALKAQLAKLGAQTAEVQALSKELAQLYRSGAEEQRWAPPIEIVKGLPQIKTMLVERLRQARTEILYFGQSPQTPALEVAQAMWERTEGGVRLRMLLDEHYFDAAEERGEEDDLLRRIKGEKRRIAELPSKMIVVDRATALLSVSKPGSEGFLVLVLRQPGLVGHCLASFDLHWARGTAA